MMDKNIFNIKKNKKSKSEIFEDIFVNEKVKIERIVSTGQKTEEGNWLSESDDEWVVLLQGKSIIVFESGERYNLNKGDYLFIPSIKKHRVEYTSIEPPCIWLAIHIKNK